MWDVTCCERRIRKQREIWKTTIWENVDMNMDALLEMLSRRLRTESWAVYLTGRGMGSWKETWGDIIGKDNQPNRHGSEGMREKLDKLTIMVSDRKRILRAWDVYVSACMSLGAWVWLHVFVVEHIYKLTQMSGSRSQFEDAKERRTGSLGIAP